MRFLDKQESFLYSQRGWVYFLSAVLLDVAVGLIIYIRMKPEGNELIAKFILLLIAIFIVSWIVIAWIGGRLKDSLLEKCPGYRENILYSGELGRGYAIFIGSGNLFIKRGPCNILSIDKDPDIVIRKDLQLDKVFFSVDVWVTVETYFTEEELFKIAQSVKLNPGRNKIFILKSALEGLITSSDKWNSFFSADVVNFLAKEKNLPEIRLQLLVLVKSIINETLLAYLSDKEAEINIALSLGVDEESFSA